MASLSSSSPLNANTKIAQPRFQINKPKTLHPVLKSVISGTVVVKESDKFGRQYHIEMEPDDFNKQVIRTNKHFDNAPIQGTPTTPFYSDAKGKLTIKVNVKDFGGEDQQPLPEAGNLIHASVEYHWYSMITEKGQPASGFYAKMTDYEDA